MRINLPRRLGTLGVVLAVTGAGLLSGSAAATAGPAPAARAGSVAAVELVFDINGTYSDGGSARPVIANNNDILTVDMSSQRRPAAHGGVVNRDTILVTFPDDATYVGKLLAPDTIRWSNGSTWRKTRTVPGVRGASAETAAARLTAAGFRVGTVNYSVDRLCNYIGRVMRQSPPAGSQQLPGTPVNIWIGTLPPTPCP